jgi:type 1 glutamine amidotransferase
MEALIVYGGWEGHDPAGVSAFLESLLSAEGFEVVRTPDVDALADDRLEGVDVIVPVVTMGDPPAKGFERLLSAIEGGVGIAGCHGGMCDAFRGSSEWQFLTGGQFVAHPGDSVRYRVSVADREHPVMQGVDDFEAETEQYYMHIDPAIHVLAETGAPPVEGPFSSNPRVKMPVAWTKHWGKGRVFYFAIGHSLADLEAQAPREIMRKGMLWAAGRL